MRQFGWTPKQWSALSVREKAVVIAGIDLGQEEEKKQQREAEAKARSHRKH
ncbi:hypothetical protein [Schleiferilactobacillus harbinensis]|jgi:hypothetical protein|uniref:Uncharacterized protein n=1 Tax=Schleiferilactobacillus harbinensis TaxID=304207 RepID=A0ABU7SZJ5_9LACO|nr:hypothetical protein [Schleiferilactobacillus harbinensis]